MSSQENVALVIGGAAFLIAALINKKMKKKRTRRCWWQSELFRKRCGEKLILDMKSQEISGHYKNFMRMSPTNFEFLLNKIGHRINKRDTYFRLAVSVQDRLAVTLRYMATGDSYTSLQYTFRISRQLIGKIIPQVCEALIEELKDYVQCPTTVTDWLKISDGFESEWNMPHCIGSLDGKHIILQAPVNSGTEFFNYKSTFSIVLMALVDANYNFIFADVGCQGRISDGGVFRNTKLWNMLVENQLGLPEEKVLPGRQYKLPYFIIGDSAFAHSKYIMKPYAGDHAKGSLKRIFNYRLSRARRVVENAFGILSAVFRVLRKPMLLEPETANKIVMCTIVLHNFLRAELPNLYTPSGSLDHEENGTVTNGSWRQDTEMTSMRPIRNIARRSSDYAKQIRDELADYFMNEGAVFWQHLYA